MGKGSWWLLSVPGGLHNGIIETLNNQISCVMVERWLVDAVNPIPVRVANPHKVTL